MKNKYPFILQLPFCCVPATLQKILYRRGLDIFDQEYIGAALGLQLPMKGKDFFSHPEIIYLSKEPKAGYGTQIEKRQYSINSFFKQNKIPLVISRLCSFKHVGNLEKFITGHLRAGHDIMLRYNNIIFNRKDGKGYGHISVIADYDQGKKEVAISDTELPFIKQVSLEQLIYATSDRIDGIKRGFYFVKRADS